MIALLQDEALLKPRCRLHLLASDLTALGVSDRDRKALPACPLTPVNDAAEALGSLYVMEGSTLGGRVIRKNLDRCLGQYSSVGCAYFNGCGADTGVMWLSFLQRLDEAPMADAERIGRGASATFERLAAERLS